MNDIEYYNLDPKKDYIYVLKLIEERYYIGRSQNILQRIDQHFNGGGSVYTKKYKPLKIVEIVEEKTNEDERNKTIEYAEKYTWEKVRGYVWCRVDYKNPWKLNNIVMERKKIYHEIDEKVKQLYCIENQDILDIGKELNITPGSVAYKLKNMNIIQSKKQAKGYDEYIESKYYEEICKNFDRQNINKNIKINIPKKEQLEKYFEKNENNIKKKIKDEVQKFKLDTKFIKSVIQNTFEKN
jgi:predicted GIY-YIG superfamily endonuclease